MTNAYSIQIDRDQAVTWAADARVTRFDVYEAGRGDDPDMGHVGIFIQVLLEKPAPDLVDVVEEKNFHRLRPDLRGICVDLVRQAREAA